MEKIEEPKERVEFIFQHPKDKTVLTSKQYTIDELIETNSEDIFWANCHCDCKPTGENSYTDCNCEDYYGEFELIGKRVIKCYTTRNDEVVKMIEDRIMELEAVSSQSMLKEYNEVTILQLKNLLHKITPKP